MPLANCLIITFRDPVQRYLSAFHYDALRHRSRSFSLNWMRSRQKPNEFIDALRDHNAQHHIVATRTLNASLFPIYIRGINGVHNNGNNFLVPQADFLRGVDCSRTTVYVLCTDTFDRDWHRLTGQASARLYTREQNRSSGRHGDTLVPRDASFVRALYADDVRLVRRFCKSS